MGPVAVVVDQVAAVVVRISKYFLGNRYAQCLSHSHTSVDLSHVKKKFNHLLSSIMRVMNQRYHPPVAEWISLGVLSYFNYFKPTTLLSDSIMIESCLLVKGAWFVNFLQVL